jgi:hypothetical protein
MGHGGRTGESLEIEATKAENYTPGVEDTDSGATGIECLSSVYFQHYHLMLPHCHLGVVVSQTGHLFEP